MDESLDVAPVNAEDITVLSIAKKLIKFINERLNEYGQCSVDVSRYTENVVDLVFKIYSAAGWSVERTKNNYSAIYLKITKAGE